MAHYAVIDTNVLVSALITKHDDAAPLQVVRHMLRGDIVPLYNEEILLEYAAVLHRAKFHLTPSAVDALLRAIVQYGEAIERLETGATLVDAKDLVFYEVTMAKRAEEDAYLVTGNKRHFPVETFVVTPGEMLVVLQNA